MTILVIKMTLMGGASMERAGVAELKARLSEYLAKVRAGEEVLVTDRGRPVARLVPAREGMPGGEEGEVELARLRALERDGLIRLATTELPEDFFEKARPADEEGLLRKAVLEEREEGF
jgi:prevent-host-death family protein